MKTKETYPLMLYIHDRYVMREREKILDKKLGVPQEPREIDNESRHIKRYACIVTNLVRQFVGLAPTLIDEEAFRTEAMTALIACIRCHRAISHKDFALEARLSVRKALITKLSGMGIFTDSEMRFIKNYHNAIEELYSRLQKAPTATEIASALCISPYSYTRQLECLKNRQRTNVYGMSDWSDGNDEDNPLEKMISDEILDDALAQFTKLPELDKKIMALRYDIELTFREIAEVLQTPLTKVFLRHHRALKKLRAVISVS